MSASVLTVLRDAWFANYPEIRQTPHFRTSTSRRKQNRQQGGRRLPGNER